MDSYCHKAKLHNHHCCGSNWQKKYRITITLSSESEFCNLTAGELNLDNKCCLNFLFWCNTAKIWVGWTMLNEEKNRRGGEGGDG